MGHIQLGVSNKHYDVDDMMVKLMMGIIMMMVVVMKMMIAGVPRC